MSSIEYRSHISISQENLKGDLVLPLNCEGLVLFAHGNGSSRSSPRNMYVAKKLNDSGFATLLVDLLTEKEKQIDITTKHLRYDIELLTNRLLVISNWIFNNPLTRNLSLGYFSSSTGTAAALNASVKLGNIEAVVSRGGRPDLVDKNVLGYLTCPSLFIIGGNDKIVINITKKLFKDHNTKLHEFIIISNASHLFEEQGKIDEVIEFAIKWFNVHLLKKNDQKFVRKHRVFSFLYSFGNIKLSANIRFKNRIAAGYTLAHILDNYKNQHNIMVIGIARGGVVVADAVAKKLLINDFSIILSKKLREPDNSEQAIGVLLHDNSIYLDSNVIESKKISNEYVALEISKQKKEMNNKILTYNTSFSNNKICDKTIILVDDGSATGSTLIAASIWIKEHKPFKLIMALPVIPQKNVELLSKYCNIIKFVRNPKNFNYVDEYYQDFDQVDDDVIKEILEKRSLL